VKNATTLEDKRITSFLECLQVPEDEISGTPPLLRKLSLLNSAKIIQVTVCRYIENSTALNSKRKCYKEGLSSQNCIFGYSFRDKKVVIHLFPKALALSVPVFLGSDGRKPTIQLTKKQLYIGHLVFCHKSKQSFVGSN